MKKTLLLLLFCSYQICFGFDLPKQPTKAALYSLIIPGGGQFYNENYWKFSSVLAIEGYFLSRTIYHSVKTHNTYERYRESLDENEYEIYLDYYYKLQNDYWWLGATVVLSMIDAYVDAHLYNFQEKKEKINLKFIDDMIILELKF